MFNFVIKELIDKVLITCSTRTMGQIFFLGHLEKEGPKNLHLKIQSFLDIFVTDRRTDRQKIIDGEIADRLLV